MIRAVLGVLAGYAVWTAVWLGGNRFLFAEAAEVVGRGEPYTAAGPLAGVLVLSVVCSLLAGWVTARVAAGLATKAVLVMAVLLLGTGIAVQAAAWSFMPVWYHVAFLALLVPVSLAGGRLGSRRAA